MQAMPASRRRDPDEERGEGEDNAKERIRTGGMNPFFGGWLR